MFLLCRYSKPKFIRFFVFLNHLFLSIYSPNGFSKYLICYRSSEICSLLKLLLQRYKENPNKA